MGKKGSWIRAVKKVFSPETKEPTKDQRTKEKSKSRWGFKKSKKPDPLSSEVPEVHPPEQIKWSEAETNQAYSVATAAAAAAEAAVVAAQAAAEVVRLASTSTKFLGKSKEEVAAIKIQTIVRGFLARRALRTLRGVLRLRNLMESGTIKRQTTATLRCMQSLSRIQTQIRSRRSRMLEHNRTLQRQIQLRREKELEALRSAIGEEWDDSIRSKEQIEASILSKQEAAMKRERALAYAFTHQGKGNPRGGNQTFMDPENPQWGWSWAERWTEVPPARAFHRSPAPSRSARVRSRAGVEEDTRSLTSVQSERARRLSTPSPSVRDDESLASSPAVPGYMAATESTRAKARLHSPDMGGSALVKKRLSLQAAADKSYSSSPVMARRHSGPPRVEYPVARNLMRNL